MAKAKTNYPDLAETNFQWLCDEHNVTRHKAFQDRTGWDYLVEFERSGSAVFARDRQLGAATARVQIKSTQGAKQKTELKLSNALNFAKEPDICFVVLFHYPSEGSPPRIYGRHFDRTLMGLTLKRAREADRDGIENINRIRIAVQFSKEDEHTSDLIPWMRSICDQQPEAYANNKRQLAETLGYEEASASGTITFRVEDLQTVIDAAVGLVDHAPVEHISLRDIRFNIPANVPIFEGKPDQFTFLAHPKPAKLHVTGSDGGQLSIAGEMRVVALPDAPAELAKAVFSSTCITAIITGKGKCDLSFEVDADVAYPLSTIDQLLNFQQITRDGAQIGFELNGQKALLGSVGSQNFSDARWFKMLAAVVRSLIQLCPPNVDPLIKLEDIDGVWSDAIRFAEFVGPGDLKLSVTLERPIEELGIVRNFAAYAWIEVGQSLFWVICRRPCMTQEVDGSTLQLSFGPPIHLEQGISEGDVKALVATLSDRMRMAVEKLGVGTVTINEGDIRSSDDVTAIMLT